jgi:hypothetical protein
VTPVPWIRLYVTFFDHPKTRRLRRELGTVEPILRLWAWAANCCQSGDLTDQSQDDIEESAGWRGERGKAFSAMVSCGFLDVDGGHVEIHGWGEKTGEGVESLTRTRALTAERVKRYRDKDGNALPNRLRNESQERQERRGEERIGEESIEEKTMSQSGEVLSLLPDEPKAKKRKKAAEGSPAFEAFWQAYPAHRRMGKPEAIRKWPGDEHARAIMSHLEAIKASVDWQKDGGDYVLGMRRYLKEETWKMPVVERKPSKPTKPSETPFFWPDATK